MFVVRILIDVMCMVVLNRALLLLLLQKILVSQHRLVMEFQMENSFVLQLAHLISANQMVSSILKISIDINFTIV